MFLFIFGSEDMGATEGIAINLALLLLSVYAGYAYGRRQFELLKRKQVGFPVITKHSDDTTAG
jgi:hypothetical protein